MSATAATAKKQKPLKRHPSKLKKMSAYMILTLILISIVAVLFAFPLYWIITGSFKTGAAIARDVFGVDDEIYNAIWWHTTGHAHMTLLEKVIYLADYIEPSRNFPGVDKLRAVCYKDLDEGLLMGLEMTIEEMTEMGNPVHHATIEARDALKG